MPTPPKIEDVDYIQFLLAAQTAFSCSEAARCSGEPDLTPAHDAFTRLLQRQPPDTEALWDEVAPFVDKEIGLLVVDDSTLDKPHARFMDLVGWHWSGKHKRSVLGINLTTLLWTDGGAILPVDCRLYDKPQSGLDKNDHLQNMLKTARRRGFRPRYVCFDSWYSGLKNLKEIRSYEWNWLTQLKSNRQVNPDGAGNVAIADVGIDEGGRIVHLQGYGFIKVFRIVHDFDNVEHWATNDLDMTEADRQEIALQAWAIEEYHRGLKQCCGVEKCQARKATSQKNHIILSVRAFVRLEIRRLETGKSWYESKKEIVRQAIRQFCQQKDRWIAKCA